MKIKLANKNIREKSKILFFTINKGLYKFAQEKGFDIDKLNIMPNNSYLNIETLPKTTSNNSIFDPIIERLEFSFEEIKYLNHIDAVISSTKSFEELEGVINELNKEIISKFDSSKATFILAGTAVLVYSINYWQENFEDWINTLASFYLDSTFSNSESSLSKISSKYFLEREEDLDINWNTLKDIGKEDVKGAVGGGITGAAVGGTASLGTLTVPSWVAGAVIGGLANSAAESIKKFLESIF